jgi:hypothetical protein
MDERTVARVRWGPTFPSGAKRYGVYTWVDSGKGQGLSLSPLEEACEAQAVVRLRDGLVVFGLT